MPCLCSYLRMKNGNGLLVKTKLNYFTPASLELLIDKRLLISNVNFQYRKSSADCCPLKEGFCCGYSWWIASFYILDLEHPVLCVLAGIILLQNTRWNTRWNTSNCCECYIGYQADFLLKKAFSPAFLPKNNLSVFHWVVLL